MALSTLPYKIRITSRVVDQAGTGWLVTFEVTNANGASVRRSGTLNIAQTMAWNDFVSALNEEIGNALVADAGGYAILLDGMIANSTRAGFFTIG